MTSQEAQSRRSTLSAGRTEGLSGVVAAPGDKSISHRALILCGLADGQTEITGLLGGDDVLRTAAAIRALGAEVEREGEVWRVTGAAWRDPDRTLYFGNSGTGCRLILGAVAGAGVSASFDGDSSLRSRPMDRILEPLAKMGANAQSENGRLPCVLGKAPLRGIEYTLPKPSAQIKSAMLLAALGATGETIIREPRLCRDHTERMLAAFGLNISIEPADNGRVHPHAGQAELNCLRNRCARRSVLCGVCRGGGADHQRIGRHYTECF